MNYPKDDIVYLVIAERIMQVHSTKLLNDVFLYKFGFISKKEVTSVMYVPCIYEKETIYRSVKSMFDTYGHTLYFEFEPEFQSFVKHKKELEKDGNS